MSIIHQVQFNRRNDNTTVREPSDEEVLEIAEVIHKDSPGSAGNTLADVAEYLSAASIAVFPKYCSDSVGYVGSVYVVVHGGDPSMTTVLLRDYWSPGNLHFQADKAKAPLIVSRP